MGLIPPHSDVQTKPAFLTWLLWLAVVLSLLSSPLSASPLLSVTTPTDFFTNVSGRLLRAELNQDLHRIQLYPANQYTPATHRLLQLAANIYDCTTNRAEFGYPYYPSVFRPIFTNDSGSIYICGYIEEKGTLLATALRRDLGDPADRASLQPLDMVVGVPVIIGARKGFPNFNEFGMETALRIARKLEFRRGAGGKVNETNQMFQLAITNGFGLGAWNSYSNPYPHAIELSAQVRVRVELTNESQSLFLKDYVVCGSDSATTNAWPGFINLGVQRFSFRLPIDPATNLSTLLPWSTYIQDAPQLVPATNLFGRNSGFPVPNWGLTVRADLLFTMIDPVAKRMVDYVNVTQTQSVPDVFSVCRSGEAYSKDSPYLPAVDPGSLWSTNRLSPNIQSPTYGVLNQVAVGLGCLPLSEALWRNFTPVSYSAQLRAALQRQFISSLFGTDLFGPQAFYAPFDPFCDIFINTHWQANDPLVHHTLADLLALQSHPIVRGSNWDSPLSGLHYINRRYEPWAPRPDNAANVTLYDLSLKDPLIGRSDDWDFPEAQTLAPEWLGQVHRGTPWMTLYLKPAPRLQLNRWSDWLNWADFEASLIAHPMADGRIISWLAPLMNTNPPASLASPNRADAAAWVGVLDGMNVLTNTSSDADFQSNPFMKRTLATVKMAADSPQALALASALQSRRLNSPNGRFTSLGDILNEPSLSTNSPWLNRTSIQTRYGISDAAYEAVPAALLGRLWPDAIGTATHTGSTPLIQFSGVDGCSYRIESSSNFMGWVAISTNLATATGFSLVPPSTADSSYFRALLWQ